MAMTAVSTSALVEAWNTRRRRPSRRSSRRVASAAVVAHPGPRIQGPEAIADHVRETSAPAPTAPWRRARRMLADGRLMLEWTFRATVQHDYQGIPGKAGT